MVVTGDITQIDLPSGVKSGLRDAMETLDTVEGVGRVKFDQRDVVRHAMVTRIVQAYDAADALRERIGKSYRQGHGDREIREKVGDDSPA